MAVMVKRLKNGPFEISGGVKVLDYNGNEYGVPEIRFISAVAVNQRANPTAMAATQP